MAQSIRLTNNGIGLLERTESATPPVNEPYLEYMTESLVNNYQTLIDMGVEGANNEGCAPVQEDGLYNNLVHELLCNFSTFWAAKRF